MASPQVSTYSMWQAFRECRRKCRLRYIDHLKPLETPHALWFGGLIHKALEVWYSGLQPPELRIEQTLAVIDNEPDISPIDRIKAKAMMTGYIERYPEEPFHWFDTELKFQGPIINPQTGAHSRSFVLAGKVDLPMTMDGGLWIAEHKTASDIDGAYLERLWCDSQIHLYADYVSQKFGEPVVGVLYNILRKTRLRQGKRESLGDYAVRLAQQYREPEMFHRERLLICQDTLNEERAELWDLTQAYLEAKRRGLWYTNRKQCHWYKNPCQYWPLCRSGENPVVRDNQYKVVEPHEELRAEESTAEISAGLF